MVSENLETETPDAPEVDAPEVEVMEEEAPKVEAPKVERPDVPLALLLSKAFKVENVAACEKGDVLHVKNGRTKLFLAVKSKKNGSGRVHFNLREYSSQDRAVRHLGGLKTA